MSAIPTDAPEITYADLDPSGPFALADAPLNVILEIASTITLVALFALAALQLTSPVNETFFFCTIISLSALVSLQKAIALFQENRGKEKAIKGICLVLTLTLTLLALLALSNLKIALNPTQLAWVGLWVGGLHTLGSVSLVSLVSGRQEGFNKGFGYTSTLLPRIKCHPAGQKVSFLSKDKKLVIPQGVVTQFEFGKNIITESFVTIEGVKYPVSFKIEQNSIEFLESEDGRKWPIPSSISEKATYKELWWQDENDPNYYWCCTKGEAFTP